MVPLSNNKKKNGKNGTTTTSKSNLKQGNLFSFFSKSVAAKPKPKSNASGTGTGNGGGKIPAATADASTNAVNNNNNNNNNNKKPSALTTTTMKKVAPPPSSASASASPKKNSNTKATPPQSSSQQKNNTKNSNSNNSKTTTKSTNTIWKKLIIGSKICIYWKDDKCYYPCTIEKQQDSSSSRFFVRYDDGESEWTDMSTEKLRWLDDDDDNDDDDGEDSEDEEEQPSSTSATASSSGTTKKRSHRRSIQESDDDDDEEEEQEWKDPGDEESEDDGSVFDADVDVDVDEEEEEEEDNWMVTDEESSPKKKKKVTTTTNKKNKKKTVKITTHHPVASAAASTSSSSTTPPPSAKRMKSSTTTATTENAFKTPLKNYSHTISPQTSSSQKSKQASNNVANSSAMKTTSMMILTPRMTNSPLNASTNTTTTTKTTNNDMKNKLRLNPHFLSFGDKPLPNNDEKGALNVRGAHIHNHLKFLRYPQDSFGRYRDNPNYDSRTLKINYNEWNTIMGCKEMTSAVKQWWELKSEYFDTVLFFKTGKFYELFHMDADIGVQVLGFNYMKGKPAHAGFPEISYGQFADKLVRAGYKVARVEQTETPAMLQIRKSNTPKSQKKPQVVNREVCSIMTLGTRTFCSLDVKLALEEGISQDDQCGGPLLVIREVLYDQNGDQNGDQDDDDDSTDGGVQPVCEYGITLIDAIRGTVTLGMFADDVLRNRMRTLLISFHPSEILIQGGTSSSKRNQNDNDENNDGNDGNGTSKELLSLLKSYQNETRTPCSIEIINQNESYPKSTALNKEHARNLERGDTVRPWNVNETLQELHRRKYYPRSSRKKSSNNNDVSRWPIVLKMVVEGDANLCLSSFGAALFYLQRNLIDREILSMNIVRAYIPAAVTTVSGPGASAAQQHTQQSQYDDDGDTKMIPAAAATSTTTTTNIDDFWTSQQQQQQQQQQGSIGTAVVTQESLLDGLEENPLYKIPTSTPQPHQQQHASAAAPTIATAAVADNNGEDAITYMTLDGTTLHNLEILTNAVDYKIVGSLWSKLNYTKSPHGSRMLRAWLLRPLFRKNEIERRGDAVEELIRGAGNLSLKEARDSVLNKIGDLDRLLSRVHSMSVGVSSGGGSPAACDDDDDDIISNEYHPNERAVLYEGKTYTKRKVLDFKNLLKGLQKACQLPEIFSDIDLDPNGFVFKLVRLQKDGGLFPDMVESLDWFMDNFDCEKAASGEFVPSRGTDPIYDQACDTVNQVKEDLENYKQEIIQDHLKPRHVAQRAWKYANIKPDSKDKYLIELPVNVEVPHDFHVKGKRGTGQKQINKYQTPVVVELVKELEQAYEIQQSRKSKGMQIIFAKFDTLRPLWAAAAQATAILDALGSLAIMAGNPGYCRAEILDCPAHQQPSINIVQGRHPVVENTFHSSDFIPNDLQLGPNPNKMGDNIENGDNGDSARLLLLSGPNMGGKSTMLRQTCLIAILAQIGSYVPAESCQLTPIDCIFTRLGASDRILLGQSTFFVELAETAAALRGATRRSLVIMDELGRGTSTFDGTAIASATVKHLVERSQCLSLFATHYHSLLDEWRNAPNVRLGHMQCIVDDENEDETTTGSNGNITFLYTLGLGSCPRSFGINVAKLAGLPDEVLANAKRVSEEFEDEMNGVGSDAEVGTAVGPKVSDEEAKYHLENIRQLIACQKYDDILSVWKTIKQSDGN